MRSLVRHWSVSRLKPFLCQSLVPVLRVFSACVTSHVKAHTLVMYVQKATFQRCFLSSTLGTVQLSKLSVVLIFFTVRKWPRYALPLNPSEQNWWQTSLVHKPSTTQHTACAQWSFFLPFTPHPRYPYIPCTYLLYSLWLSCLVPSEI